MRFIIATVDDFKRIPNEIGPPDIDYRLLYYVDTEVDKLSLVDLNGVIKRIRETKEMDTWNLPLLDSSDYDTLSNSGYAIIRRINHKIYEHRWILLFDIQHSKNGKLVSVIRDRKLNDLV